MKNDRRWTAFPSIFYTVFVLFLLQCSPVSAQDVPDSAAPPERMDVVVTYAREETPRKEASADITVITHEEIEKMPAVTVADVLSFTPGVSVSGAESPGNGSSISIQGSLPRQVAVYQDGVPLNLLGNPMTDLSAISLDTVERIEVYRGAASSAWGSALGGVVNIITKEPNPTKPISVQSTASFGSFETMRGSLAASGTLDRLGYFVETSHQESSGFQPDTAFRNDTGYGKFNWQIGPTSRVNFVVSHEEGRNEEPVAAIPPFWDDYHHQRTYERLLLESAPSAQIKFTIEARRQDYDARAIDMFPDGTTNTFFNYSQQTWGGSARISYDNLEHNRFGAGFDGDFGSYDFLPGSENVQYGNWAFYADDSYRIGKFTLNGGVRYDENLDFGSAVSPSGGVTYALPIWDGVVRFQAGHGFSAPPGTWVHMPVYGNPDLKPEWAFNEQLGVEVKPWKPVKLGLNLFRADVDDFIVWNNSLRHYDNIASVVRQGVEGTASFTVARGLTLAAGGSFIDVRDVETGETVKDIPRVIGNTSVTWTWKWITQSLAGKLIYHNAADPDTNDRVFIFDYLVKFRLPGAGGKPSPFTLFAVVHDIGDSGYHYSQDFPHAGRWGEAGARVEF